MRVTDEHWLTGTRRVPSPHCDDRSHPDAVELVVIHGISLPPGQFGGGFVEDLFLGRIDTAAHPSFESLEGLRVSSHLFISRRGAVTQFVPFHRRAWHAGVSAWRGRAGCNEFSIGIELEGTDEGGYTESQYRKLGVVLNALLARYPQLSPDAIVGHLEVAMGRKTDPGHRFDWRRVLTDLA